MGGPRFRFGEGKNKNLFSIRGRMLRKSVIVDSYFNKAAMTYDSGTMQTLMLKVFDTQAKGCGARRRAAGIAGGHGCPPVTRRRVCGTAGRVP